MVYGNPLSDMTRSRGGVNPNDVVAALEQAFVAEFGSPGKIPLQAIVFEVVRP